MKEDHGSDAGATRRFLEVRRIAGPDFGTIRVCLAWQLTGRWRYDPDPADDGEMELRFIAEDGG